MIFSEDVFVSSLEDNSYKASSVVFTQNRYLMLEKRRIAALSFFGSQKSNSNRQKINSNALQYLYICIKKSKV